MQSILKLCKTAQNIYILDLFELTHLEIMQERSETSPETFHLVILFVICFKVNGYTAIFSKLYFHVRDFRRQNASKQKRKVHSFLTR